MHQKMDLQNYLTTQEKGLKYDGSCIFIKNDLKRLKSWTSLAKDIYGCYKIVNGAVKEIGFPPTVNSLGGLITEIKCSHGTLLCYKDRFPITNPCLTPSEGGRIIFAIIKEQRIFIPLLVYAAKEEKGPYKINNKKFFLTKNNLGKIIKEKIIKI